MRTSLLAAVLLAAAGLLLAGCLADGGGDGQDQQETVPAETGASQQLFLTGDGGLREAEPTGEPERVPAGNFYTAWAQGQPQPTWRGSALAGNLLVDHVDLSFYYTSESATATTGPQEEGFPEFVVYVGTDEAPMAWASVEGPDVVQQGEQVHVEAELALPEGGLVLPAGVKPIVKLAPVQGQGETEDTRIEFLVNGTQTPSHAYLEGSTIELPANQPERVVDETGTLVASAYALGADEQTTADTYEIAIEEGHVGLQASLQRVQGAGIADIDLEVLDEEGEVVARSVTPEAVEGIHLYEPNVEAIGEGTWTVRVVNYGNAAVEYELTVDVLERSDP